MTGRRIWELLSPLLVFLLCSLAASVIVAAAVAVRMLGEGAFSPDELIRAATEQSLTASLISFLAAIVIFALFRRHDNRRFGKETPRWPVPLCVLGIAGVAAAGILGNLLLNSSHLSDLFPLYEKIAEMTFTDQDPVLLAVTAGIAGPLAEELAFRGLVQRRACSFMRPRTAVLLTALLFGLYHMNMIQFLYAFPLGLLLGALYWKSGDLKTAVLAHMAANMIVLAIF